MFHFKILFRKSMYQIETYAALKKKYTFFELSNNFQTANL